MDSYCIEDSYDIELVVLGTIYLDQKLEFVRLDELFDKYFSPENRELFKKVVKYREQNLPYDYIVAREHFSGEEYKLLNAGISYLTSIVNYQHYFKKLKQNYVKREILRILQRFNENGKLDVDGLKAILKEYTPVEQFRIFELKKGLSDYISCLEKRIVGDIETYQTFIPSLDEFLGKIYPGTSIIVGGRTSLGKTSLLLKFAWNNSKRGIRALFLSAEMSAEQLLDRIMSTESRIDLFSITNAKLTSGDQKKILKVANEKLYGSELWIVEITRFSEKAITDLIERSNAKIVFVDYIQRFQLPERYDTRASAFAEIANSLKTIAREENVVIFSGSQLSRQVELRADRIATLADLKESGGLEESADIVLLLEDTGIENEEVKKVNIKIAKNRQGPTGSILFAFHKKYCDFSPLDSECQK